MRTPPLDYASLVRLEVETTPAGLPNLFPNPNGDQGAWFWLTPVATQLITTVAGGLKFTTTTATTAYMYSEMMPVAAGRWVQGSINVTGYQATTSGQVTGSLIFYDADGAIITGGGQDVTPGGTYGTVGGALGTTYTSAALAPAGTSFVAVRWELLRADTQPNAGDWFTFNKVMVTHTATLAALTTRRTNLILNPQFPSSFVGTVGWSINSTHTLTWDGTWSVSGNISGSGYTAQGSAKLTSAGSGTAMQATTAAGTAGMPVTAGLPYALQAMTRAATTPRSVALAILWYTAAGALISTSTVSTFTNVTTVGGLNLGGVATAPATAAYAQARVQVTGAVAGEVHWFDAVLFEQSNVVGGYFDGSIHAESTTTAGGTAASRNAKDNVYPNGSISYEDTSSWAYVDPFTWRNILGTSHELQIDRHPMDVGSLSAVIYDANLDPATAADMRPGKRVRVQAWTGAAFESLFEGKIAAAKATYLRRDDQSTAERVRVDMTAEDNTATLANQKEARGVGTLAELPWVLEGHGVPWSVNGSGNQVKTAVQVAANDAASVLDQVALVRDTVNAQAFVDRTNVLVVRTNPTVATAGFTDDPTQRAAGKMSYNDIEIDFSTDNLINEVTVVWLRYNSTTGETTEVTYGPYRSTGSIRTWGTRAATYTLQGATENSATIAAYARNILAANAQPVVRPRKLTAPIKTAQDMTLATRYDLGHQVPVIRAGRLNSSYNVTGISHTITPELWQATYEFDPPGSVASPTFTPPPPPRPALATMVTAASVITPSAGWSVAAGQFYRQGRTVHARVTMQRTGANIALSTPDYADQVMGNLDAAWRPVQAVSTATYVGFRAVQLLSAGNINTTGGLADGIYTGSGINTNDQVAFGVTYLLPEGV